MAVARVPQGLIDTVQRLMEDRGLSKDEAWARVLRRAAFSDESVGPPAAVEAARAPREDDTRKRTRVVEDELADAEPDEGSVSNDELSDYLSSVASAPDALADAAGGDKEGHTRLVAKLRAEVARLKRKQRPSFEDLLDPKAGAFCKLMTGLSRLAVERLWERYGPHFEDDTFTVTPVPLKPASRATTRRPPSASLSSSSSVSYGGVDDNGGDEDDVDDDDVEDDENEDGEEQPLTQPQEPVYLRGRGRLPTLPPKDRLYLLLRALRTCETQALLADRFGIAQKSVSRYITRGLTVLRQRVVPDFLVIPSPDSIVQRSNAEWRAAFGDGVVLTADGTHFQIDVPEDYVMSWLTYCYYKGYNSQQTLLLVDSAQLIVGVSGLMAGRAHELTHVWKDCGMQRVLDAYKGKAHVTLLADKAYVSFVETDNVTVRTPAKSKTQFSVAEQNQTRVVAK
jgi:hypothetical protein